MIGRYKFIYKTPDTFANIVIASDGEFLTGLVFENSKNATMFDEYEVKQDLVAFKKTIEWLDIYFGGNHPPQFTPEFIIKNENPFRKRVFEIILKIPFGQTLTYNDIAKQLAVERKIEKMSARAVGGAVGSNLIYLIIPCHRVVGKNGQLIGYGGGMENKKQLLNLEQHTIIGLKIKSK